MLSTSGSRRMRMRRTSGFFSQWLSIEKQGDAGLHWNLPKVDDLGETEASLLEFEDIEDLIVEVDLQRTDGGPLVYLLSPMGLCEGHGHYDWLDSLRLLDDLERLESTCIPFLDLVAHCKFSFKVDWLRDLSQTRSLGASKDTDDGALILFCRNILNLLLARKPDLPAMFWKQLFDLELKLKEKALAGDAKRARAAVEAVAKEHIAKRQNCFPIWAAYASFQRDHGSATSACKIYLSLLSSVKPSSLRSGGVPEMFLELATLLGKSKKASEKVKMSPDTVLGALATQLSLADFAKESGLNRSQMARRSFQKVVERALSEGSLDTEASVTLVLAAAKFEQLDGSDRGALGICKQAMETILSSSSETSGPALTRHTLEFCERSARLVLSLKSIETEKAQSFFALGLQLFPSSPLLLTAYMRAEYECGAVARLEKTLATLVDDERSPTALLALLIHESEKKHYKVHHSFEKHLGGGFGQSCLIWRAYLRYLVLSGRPDQAREHYGSAVRACPWSKELLLDGFGLLNEHLSSKEKVQGIKAAQGKGIGLHTDLYESILEDHVRLFRRIIVD